MKKIVFIILLCGFILNAQDKEPIPWKFRWGHSDELRVFSPDSIKQTSFLTGFQWGGSTNMNNALHNNVWTGGNYGTVSSTPIRKQKLILQPKWHDSTNYGPGYWGAVMMQYEPTLPLSGSNEGTILRPNDTTDPVFGFRYRRGTISSNPLDENYSRLVLKQADKVSYGGDRVLEDIWPQPYFETRKWGLKGGDTDNYLGRKWYLVVNMRRLNPDIDIIKDDSVVINIRMPYTRWDSASTNMIFRKLPIDHPDSTEKLFFITNQDTADAYSFIEPKGYAQLMQADTSTVISITRNMIPTASDNSENITLYAEFVTTEDMNSYFAKSVVDDPQFIKDFDIKVDYLGKLDVAIDYIRVESFEAHMLMRGEVDWHEPWNYNSKDGRAIINSFPAESDSGFAYTINNGVIDSTYTLLRGQPSDIYNILQSAINSVKIESNGWADADLFRFKFQDTENDSYYWWGALRYCNKLGNGMFMTRDGLQNPKLYNYYTKSPNKWLGIGLSASDREIPAPYAINTERDNNSMHLDFGYLGAGGNIHFGDTLNSDYETHLMNYDSSDVDPGLIADWEDLQRDSYYLDTLLKYDDVIQSRFEGQAYEHYYKNTFKSSFLFSDIQWFQYNLFYNYRLKYDSIADRNYFTMHYYRPKTAEEMRLVNSSIIIMGGKGIISDGDRNKVPPNISPGNMGIGDNTKLNEYNDIYSDSVGTDFIDARNDVWEIRDSVDLVKIAENWRVDTSRVYIGTKSYRAELFEQHSFIRANDSLLMNLRLSAAMSKGFRKHYTQDYQLYGSDTLLSSFIDLNETNTFTSKLPGSTNEYIYPEPFDSSFVDITLLREIEKPIDSVFYIGVLNRRTDPLFLYPAPYDSNSYLRFFSSAEFRDSCMNSPDSLEYQSYWWKRQGTRRVTIPFDYTYSDQGDYNLLRISEIGSDVDSLNSLWHRGEKYYDLVTDTVIGQDRSLSFNLLPGQAKILKVEVLKVEELEGFLDNYNQTNLIGYPDPLDTNMITYHLAFYKNSILPIDSTKTYKEVHYIQSLPILKNSSDENIVWNSLSRKNLSREFLENEDINDTTYADCNHPALVVRNDSLGNPFAYIVYTCADTSATLADSARVVEAVIDISTNTIKSNVEIYKLSTPDIEKQGTPTINASANGNYLAWTDYNSGLVIGYHTPEASVPSILDTIKNYDFFPICQGIIRYPSFNTYSQIEKGEDNAGLVWYQDYDCRSDGIFYSRVRHNSTTGLLDLNVPDTYEGYFSFIYSPFQTMIQIDTVSMETKPIIYRNLIPYSLSNPFACTYNRIDNINWIDKNNESIFFAPTMIKGITLFHSDTNNVNDNWKSSRYRKILFSSPDNTANIKSINSAQQDGLLIDTSYVLAGGDYNLDYSVDNAQIYQVPSNNGSNNFSSTGGGVWDINYKHNASRRASEGKNVQLAKTPKPNFSLFGEMWKNRRVFETSDEDSLDNPIIKTSANLFYKTYANEVVNHGFFGFTGDSNDVYFDLPKLEGDFGEVSSLNVQFERTNLLDPCDIIFTPDDSKDTLLTKGILFTDFDNDGDMEMQMSMFGHKNADVKVILERVLDSTQVELTMPNITSFPNNSTKLIYSIIDSLNSEFKLIYINNDTTAHFNERSYFGGLESNDTISYKSAIQKDPVKYIIDFNNGGIQYQENNTNDFELTVYPNPTSGNLRVQAFLPEKLDGYKISNRTLVVTIYDATGRMVTSQNGATGQMFDFDLSNSPAGAYIINVEHSEGNKKYMATERIVKE
ncbi:MAG: T9SS type A sorting domain-containing protein [Ignavibacteria bacterium]|nr:T9SS type A sorting domain-containing protein [Ignavibacteria bacterium]